MTEDTTTESPVINETAADPVVETAPAAETDAPADVAPADLPEEVAAPEVDPTLEEAEAMFKDRPGLDSIRTQSGWLTRDGVLNVLTPALSGE